MSSAAPDIQEIPYHPPAPVWKWGILPFRIILGLFVLWHTLALILSNSSEYLQEAVEDAYWTWEELQPVDPAKKNTILQLTTLQDAVARSNVKELTKAREALQQEGFLIANLGETIIAADHWLRWTGQEQGWSLFAPTVAGYSIFPAVELRWDSNKLGDLPQEQFLKELQREEGEPLHSKEPVLLLSKNEPVDISTYFRMGNFRLRRFESQLDIHLRLFDRTLHEASIGNPEKDEKGWTTKIRNKVWRERKEILAYLRWRMNDYLQKHPDVSSPTQVRLLLRVRTISNPEGHTPYRWHWKDEEMNIPVARWLPWHTEAKYPLQYFDPRFQVFESY